MIIIKSGSDFPFHCSAVLSSLAENSERRVFEVLGSLQQRMLHPLIVSTSWNLHWVYISYLCDTISTIGNDNHHSDCWTCLRWCTSQHLIKLTSRNMFCSLLEVDHPEITDTVISQLSGIRSSLKKMTFRGAQILLQKLDALSGEYKL